MKNKIYSETVKFLINSNLLLFKGTDKVLKDINKKNLNYLDPIEFIKNIKQFLRILQFLKNQTKSKLYLETDNFLFKETLLLIKSRKLRRSLEFVDNFLKSKDLNKRMYRTKKTSHLFLYLNQNFFTSNYFKQLFLKRLFLIQCINSKYSLNNLGFYKIYSHIDDAKAIFFFILLLKKNL
jgi:hypothetical protein